jgi:hypothetical protein
MGLHGDWATRDVPAKKTKRSRIFAFLFMSGVSIRAVFGAEHVS